MNIGLELPLSEPMVDLASFRILADGLDHPEGVACGPDGSVWAGGEAGQVYLVAEDGRVSEIASTGGFLLGLCHDADGTVYACDNARKAIMRITSNGAVDVYCVGGRDRPLRTPNYPVFDADGVLYVSDSGDWDADNGCVWAVDPGGDARILSAALTAFPNGLAIDPASEYLYVVLSQAPGVARLPLRGGLPEMVVPLPKLVPDGIAFDRDGTLYIACYAPDAILTLAPDGALRLFASDWRRVTLASPTNLAFCGRERTTLVVGSLCRWHLASLEVAVPGASLNYPRII